MGIESRREVEAKLSPVDQGTLFHGIACRLYPEQRDEGSTRFTASQLDSMAANIRAIGQEEQGRYNSDGSAWQAFRATLFGPGARKISSMHSWIRKTSSPYCITNMRMGRAGRFLV